MLRCATHYVGKRKARTRRDVYREKKCVLLIACGMMGTIAGVDDKTNKMKAVRTAV